MDWTSSIYKISYINIISKLSIDLRIQLVKVLCSLVSCAKRCSYYCDIAQFCNKILDCECEKQIIEDVLNVLEQQSRLKQKEVRHSEPIAMPVLPEMPIVKHNKPVLSIWNSPYLKLEKVSMPIIEEKAFCVPEII